MSILINPFPQYNDLNGKPLVGGTLSFFESGSSTTLKTIFVDKDKIIEANNPQDIVAGGFLEDKIIYLTGDYNVILKDIDDVEQKQGDPVFSFEAPPSQLSDYDNSTEYDDGDLVRGDDGCYYQLNPGIGPSIGNDPVLDPVSWSKIRFLPIFNPNVSYNTTDNNIVLAIDGLIYHSLVNNNLGNEPSSSPGEWSASADPSGVVLPISQVGHNLVPDDVVRVSGGVYVKAQADTLDNSQAIGIVVSSLDDDNFVVQFSGFSDQLTGLTPDTLHFLDASIEGALTTTEPTISKPMVFSVTATTGWILPQRPIDSTGSGFELVETQVASSSTFIDFTDLDSTGFIYKLYISGLVPQTNATDLYMRTSTNNGISFDNGAADYRWHILRASNATNIQFDTADTQINITEVTGVWGIGNIGGENFNAEITIYNPSDIGFTTIGYETKYNTSNNSGLFFAEGSSQRSEVAAVNAIQFFMDVDDIDEGIFKLYKLRA